MPEFDFVVDGLFGTGLNRPPTGVLGQLINGVNKSQKKTFSID